jgi:hypothetical protein
VPLLQGAQVAVTGKDVTGHARRVVQAALRADHEVTTPLRLDALATVGNPPPVVERAQRVGTRP